MNQRKWNSTIWIDLDNTPHVPFFRPIIRELEKGGVGVVISARDAYQVCELATKMGVPYVQIGHHSGKNKILKVAGIVLRSLQLMPFARRNQPLLGISHGSRAQILLCNLIGIPTILIGDYEYTKAFPLTHPTLLIVPETLGPLKPMRKAMKVLTYPGLKEDVYAPEFRPDESLLPQLGINSNDIVVSVRPPATEAHYYREESSRLFEEFMKWVLTLQQTRVVMLPRNRKQEAEMRAASPRWFGNGKVIIPDQVVDGLNLIWHSDLVVSGGGTMNREAAALGVPVYSIFRGEIGAVDRQLSNEGRLVLIENKDDFAGKIVVEKRDRGFDKVIAPRPALGEMVRHITQFAEECQKAHSGLRFPFHNSAMRSRESK